jgi:hypothetical protein
MKLSIITAVRNGAETHFLQCYVNKGNEHKTNCLIVITQDSGLYLQSVSNNGLQ